MSAVKPHLARAAALLASRKRVLFVEGIDDVAIYAKWMAKIDALYANRLEIVATNGRNDLDTALASLGHPVDAYALRDRDEWDAARIATVQTASPRFLVNANRHCIESYFCDPDEIVAMLLAKDGPKYGPGEFALRASLSAPLADWVDHWSMWTTAMRLQGNMVSAGYASFFHEVIPLPTDADIQTRIQSWSALADTAVVWKSFWDRRAAARLRSAAEKHRSCVHAKKYWKDVVLPALRAIETRSWMIDLAEWSAVPADLEPLLRTALL